WSGGCQSCVASIRCQESVIKRLTSGTISSPPGTGNSCGQRVVKPHWTSVTSNPLWCSRIGSMFAVLAAVSIRLGEDHPPLRRLAGHHARARLFLPVERNTPDGRLGLGGDAVLGLAGAVPVRP